MVFWYNLHFHIILKLVRVSSWPWYGGLVIFEQYDASEFLDVSSYKNVLRWANEIYSREPVKRGRMVNRVRGELHEQLRERHDVSDFETKTQDKLKAAE